MRILTSSTTKLCVSIENFRSRHKTLNLQCVSRTLLYPETVCNTVPKVKKLGVVRMKIFQIVLVLCILNSSIWAVENRNTNKNATDDQAISNTILNGKISQDIRDHFTAEKEASIYYLGVGAVTTMAGLYYKNEADGYYPSPIGKQSDFAYNTGLYYPLLGVGLFQLATGGLMYLKSDKKAGDLIKDLENNPADFKEQELKRMETVSDWNQIFRYTEFAMIGGGLLALYSGQQNDKEYLKGFGTGLIIQGIAMFALDYFSKERSDSYKEKVINFNFSYIPAVKNQNAYAINSLGQNGTTRSEGYYAITLTYRF